jgi:hypothetical protein
MAEEFDIVLFADFDSGNMARYEKVVKSPMVSMLTQSASLANENSNIGIKYFVN